MEALLGCLVLVLISAPLHQRSEAISQTDADRVLISYNQGFDNCRDITDFSLDVSKAAADDACEQAFFALDRLGNNTCHGWRNAGCRLFSGQKTRQCACFVSHCDGSGVRNYIPKPFRECAKKLSAEEARTGIRPSPTMNFQQRRRRYDDALQAAKKRRAFIHPDHYERAGGSSTAYSLGGAGTSKRAKIAVGAGGLRDVLTTGGGASRRPPANLVQEYTPNPFPCPHCSKSYVNKRTLVAHMKSHKSKETTCPVCHKVFSIRGNLKAHIDTAHPGTPLPETAARVGRRVVKEPGPFICGKCGRKFIFRNNLKNHAKSHETLDTHCFQCNRTLTNKGSYRAHMWRYHPDDALAADEAENQRYIEENPEVCGICKKRFKNAEGLYEHKFSHEGKTTCNICGAVFTRRANMYSHRLKVHPPKP